MSDMEIRDKIDSIYEQIQHELIVNQFVLNTTIADLYTQIGQLQNQCKHKFEFGTCIYCGKGEETK